jgi:hypothetical protein
MQTPEGRRKLSSVCERACWAFLWPIPLAAVLAVSGFLADYWVNLAYLSRHPPSGPQPFYSLLVFLHPRELLDWFLSFGPS